MKIVKNPNTDVDVDLLWKVFPDLTWDGREITHSQIEAVLHDSRLSSRYRRVVKRWRNRLLQERGLYLDGQMAHGNGFIVLTPDEMVRFGNRTVRAAGRKVRRALQVISVPDDAALSDDVRRYRNLLNVAMEKIAREHKSSLREIANAMKPMAQLPTTPCLA